MGIARGVLSSRESGPLGHVDLNAGVKQARFPVWQREGKVGLGAGQVSVSVESGGQDVLVEVDGEDVSVRTFGLDARTAALKCCAALARGVEIEENF